MNKPPQIVRDTYMDLMIVASGKTYTAIYKWLDRHGLTPVNQESVITYIMVEGKVLDIPKKKQAKS